MPFGEVYTPGISGQARAGRWLSHSTGATLQHLDKLWANIEATNTTATISSDYTLLALNVPKPPEGYRIWVEAWCNGYWSAGSAIDSIVKLEVGDRVIAQATVKTDINSTLGSISPHLSALYSPKDGTNFRLQLDFTAACTSMEFENRGIVARYVKEA